MYIKMKPEEIELLPAVKHVVITDGNVKSIEIETANGIFLLSYEQYGSGLTVNKIKPDVFETRFVLSGIVNELPIVDQIFSSMAEAELKARHLDSFTIEEKEINVTKNPGK